MRSSFMFLYRKEHSIFLRRPLGLVTCAQWIRCSQCKEEKWGRFSPPAQGNILDWGKPRDYHIFVNNFPSLFLPFPPHPAQANSTTLQIRNWGSARWNNWAKGSHCSGAGPNLWVWSERFLPSLSLDKSRLCQGYWKQQRQWGHFASLSVLLKSFGEGAFGGVREGRVK